MVTFDCWPPPSSLYLTFFLLSPSWLSKKLESRSFLLILMKKKNKASEGKYSKITVSQNDLTLYTPRRGVITHPLEKVWWCFFKVETFKILWWGTQGFLTVKIFQIDAIFGWSILVFAPFWPIIRSKMPYFCRQTINPSDITLGSHKNQKGCCCCQISWQSGKPGISPLVLRLWGQVGCQKKGNSSFNLIF